MSSFGTPTRDGRTAVAWVAFAFGALLVLLSPHGTARAQAATASSDGFAAALQALTASSFSDKADAIGVIEQIQDRRTLPVLAALLDGRLYYRKSDTRFVFISDAEDGVQVTDVLSGEDLGVVGKRTVKKVTINNQLRGQLRTSIAQLSLVSDEADTRLEAVREIMKDLDPAIEPLLRKVLVAERDSDVREALRTALALLDVTSENEEEQLAAIDTLAESMHPEAHNRLVALVADTAGQDPKIRRAAEEALERIEFHRTLYGLVETTFFGLSLGSVLLLAAIGLAITFGVMGVINMAHGELIMLGAYTTYVVQLLMPNYIDYSLFVAVPAAFLVAGLFGIAIERGVIRYMYGRPLETLLATFGISLILQQLVRSIFSPLNRSVSTPEWMSGSLQLNSSLSLTYNRLYIVVFSLMVFLALLAVLKRTRLGLYVRAVSQNRPMAKAMGVRTEWVDALTFGLGSGIAGVAGVALSQLTNVGPNLGQAYIIDSFMVVVFGGVGNLWGTFVGAMSLGVVNKFLEPWAGAVLAKILVLVFIILFIQKRPRGLFPQKGRAAEG